MKETKLKAYHFAVVERISNIKTVEDETALYRVGDKEIFLVEFVTEEESAKYFEALVKRIDPETESFRILANEGTAFQVQAIIDENQYYKKRLESTPIKNAKGK